MYQIEHTGSSSSFHGYISRLDHEGRFKHTDEDIKKLYNGQIAVNPDKVQPFWLPAAWVPEEDWKHTVFNFTVVIKAFFDILAVIIILARALAPAWQKQRLTWVGQTIIFFQLLALNGLTPGRFGGFINEIHEGAIKAMRRYFAHRWMPKIDDDISYAMPKYYQNNYTHFIFEECFI